MTFRLHVDAYMEDILCSRVVARFFGDTLSLCVKIRFSCILLCETRGRQDALPVLSDRPDCSYCNTSFNSSVLVYHVRLGVFSVLNQLRFAKMISFGRSLRSSLSCCQTFFGPYDSCTA